MWSIANELITAEDFIAYLDEVYGRSKINAKTVEDAIDAWQTWENQGMTPSQNIVDITGNPFATYQAYFDDILTACDLTDIDASLIYFSLIRINNLNAYAHTMPNTDKIIVFDENLISFFTAFIITAMVSVYSQPSAIETKQLENFIISNLKTFHGDASSKTPQIKTVFAKRFMQIIKKNYKLTEIGCYFSIAFTVFIICHELSHHILGHAEDKRMHVTHNTQGKKHAIPLNTPAYEEEFEADIYGYKLFLEVIDKVDQMQSAKLSQWFNRAPLIFFEMIDIVQLFTKTTGKNQYGSDTHPEAMQRKKCLIAQYEKTLHPDGLELYNRFMTFSRHIKQILVEMSEYNT